MEPSDSWITYWWVIPLAALLLLGYAALRRSASSPARAALISVILGVAGLLFSPLAPFAIHFGRKARAGQQTDATAAVMSRIGIVLGVVGSAILALFLLIIGIYFYAWITGQYPYGPANP